MDKVHSFVVDEDAVRLDKYVTKMCPELSRTYAQRLINEGKIRVNDRIARSSLKLSLGDKLKVIIPPAAPQTLTPEALPLNIIYEDDDVLVVDKPAGIAVHPAPGHQAHTLVNAILFHLPSLPESDDWLRPGIVHRLDKDVSGVMVVAKNSSAQANLISQFKARSVVKVYLVLVKGKLSPEHGVIEAPIGRDPHNRKRMAVVTSGREARTLYDVIKYLDSYTLIEVRTETGRTHQIRVHLSAIGYPVLGDKVYGVKSPHLERPFLHACRLGFKLPQSGEYKEFTSELPPDLEQFLKDLA